MLTEAEEDVAVNKIVSLKTKEVDISQEKHRIKVAEVGRQIEVVLTNKKKRIKRTLK